MTEQKVYRDLKEVVTDFINGHFEINSEFMFNNLTYRYTKTSNHPFNEYLQGKAAFILYSVGRRYTDEAKQQGADQVLAFVWKLNKSTQKISPVGIVPTTEARYFKLFKENEEQNIIGDIVNVSIIKPAGFSFREPIKGKIDSGASMCSLHVDSWRENNGNIDFVSSLMADGKTFSVPKENMIGVKSAESVEYRPIITMSLRINDHVIPDVQVNLNNRVAMKYPLLIGQNALEKGKFLIDPSLVKDRYESLEDEYEFDDAILEDTINNFNFDEQTKEITIESNTDKSLTVLEQSIIDSLNSSTFKEELFQKLANIEKENK